MTEYPQRGGRVDKMTGSCYNQNSHAYSGTVWWTQVNKVGLGKTPPKVILNHLGFFS
jgi:hypothetical protein